jgi:threonine dehydratase
MVPWRTDALRELIAPGTDVYLKLELFQHTGTFKLRGALMSIEALTPEARRAGIAAMSGGNHAIAVAYAARLHGISAKVVMPRTASPVRRDRCIAYGAEVIQTENIQEAFERVQQVARTEGRSIVHPFEGEQIALGTGTLGLEICEQLPGVDVVIVPVGGGGLAAGVACAIKQLEAQCHVHGIEPTGAPSLHASLEKGEPVTLAKIATIADSLASPLALPYSFALCRRFLDGVSLVSDDELRRAMALLFAEMKLAVEPAAAAATAGLLGPLREACAGKRVCIIVCGSNIDVSLLAMHIKQASPP